MWREGNRKGWIRVGTRCMWGGREKRRGKCVEGRKVKVYGEGSGNRNGRVEGGGVWGMEGQ